MSLTEGILMSRNQRKYDLEMEATVDGGLSDWQTNFTNASYSRTIFLDDVDNLGASDSDTMPAKGGTSVTAQVTKLTGPAFADGTITFLKNGGAENVTVFNAGDPIDAIWVFNALAIDDVIRIEILEGP